MKYSENYEFSLPYKADNDPADIDILSKNFELIDEILKRHEGLLGNNANVLEKNEVTLETSPSEIPLGFSVCFVDTGKFVDGIYEMGVLKSYNSGDENQLYQITQIWYGLDRPMQRKSYKQIDSTSTTHIWEDWFEYAAVSDIEQEVVSALQQAKERGEFDGANGYTPQKGVDYWTDEDKAEITAQVQAVCVAKNQGSANVGKILVVGTDGNLTLADMPEGGASGDVVGVLDESNNILLSGNLADGTYTLKYENTDGTYTEIGTLEVGAIPEPEEIVNQIPISTDSSGAVYNGTGYKSGVRLSSDGVTEKTDATVCVLTGYIPAVAGDIIRTKNVIFGGSDTGYISQLWCYNASFGKVSNHSNATGIFGTVINGIYTITVPSDASIAYIRLQAQILDSTSIVTKNQEIV